MLTLEKVLVIGNSRLLFGYKSGSPSYSDHLSIMETEMTTFVEANLGGIHEKFVLLVSGCLGCRPFAFIFKKGCCAYAAKPSLPRCVCLEPVRR